MRVKAFAPFPGTGPSTRYRLLQFREALADRGLELELIPFVTEEEYRELYLPRAWRRAVPVVLLMLRALARRFRELDDLGDADVVLVQRELAPVLNGLLLRRLLRSGRPLVYDFDDAVFLPQPGSHPLLQLLRRPATATKAFCRRAVRVLAGNGYLADFARRARRARQAGQARRTDGGVEESGGVQVLPTVVDTARFHPRPEASGAAGKMGDRLPVLGWIGTHSTLPYLTGLYPALSLLAERVPFRLTVVSNREPPPAPGVDQRFRRWSPDDEVALVQDLDVGLYPLTDDSWTRGKCGFKALQYLACGVPTVASPVGVLPDIVIPGKTGHLASTTAEWLDGLELLLTDPDHRRELGRTGRLHVVEKYSVDAWVDTLADALRP